MIKIIFIGFCCLFPTAYLMFSAFFLAITNRPLFNSFLLTVIVSVIIAIIGVGFTNTCIGALVQKDIVVIRNNYLWLFLLMSISMLAPLGTSVSMMLKYLESEWRFCAWAHVAFLASLSLSIPFSVFLQAFFVSLFKTNE